MSRFAQLRFQGPESPLSPIRTEALVTPSQGEAIEAVGQDAQERALDEGVDYFQVQGALARERLEGSVG